MRRRTQSTVHRSKDPEPGAAVFVWGIWGLLTLAAAGFVAHYGSNVPVWDDYSIVPQLAGAQPISFAWLWEQCNEHRIPLPKLILLSADRLAGNDVRAGMLLSVAFFSALSAALIALASNLPGGTRSSDALIPVLLLTVGQATNLLWSHQLLHSLSITLGTAYLLPIVARASWPGRWPTVLAGFGLALLPLCGGTGLMFVPGLALWMFGIAIASFRFPNPRRGLHLATVIALMLPGLAVSIFYFRGFHKGIYPAAPDGIFDNLRTGLQFLTGGIGTPGAVLWPWSGIVTLGLIALCVIFLGWGWLVRPDERPRIFGLAAFLLSQFTIAGAVGWGRGWSGSMAGFQDRFITMAIPLWCWFVFVFRLYMPSTIGRLLLNGLFAGLCACAWPNTQAGLQHGRDTSARQKRLRVILPPACRLIASSESTHRFFTRTRTSFRDSCR